MTILRTACPLDCPDGCTLQVTVTDDRLTRVDALPAGAGNPLTQGWICAKVRRHADRVHGPDRVLTPLIRTGPKRAAGVAPDRRDETVEDVFRPATWDEALDLVAARLVDTIETFGPAAVVPYLYSSSAGELGTGLLGPLLWEALGASTVAHTICAATAGEAWELVLGDRPGTDLTTIVDADLVVVWGANPSVSNTHLPPLVRTARGRGAALVVIDPRRTPLGALADVHLAVHPGTDVVLAMAVAARLHALGRLRAAKHGTDGTDRTAGTVAVDGRDEYLAACAEWSVDRAAAVCGVEASAIDELVSLLGTRSRPFFRLGWGLERNRNGGGAHRAVLSLAALTGALDGEPGAGVHVQTGHDAGLDLDALTTAVLGVPGATDDQRRAAAGPVRNMNHAGRWLAADAEAPAHFLFVQGANPAVSAPDQVGVLRALARHDLFTVVHDQVLTDTARCADVVLPATTHFETADLMAPYGAFWTELVEPVIPRVGLSRTNDEVTAALAARLGFPADRFDPDPQRVVERAGGFDRLPRGIVASASLKNGRAQLVVDRDGIDRVPVFRPVRAHGTRHPLTLLSPASAKTINSIFGERDESPLEVRLHPDDASRREIADGDDVTVSNDQGSVDAVAQIDDRVRAGVVTMVKGRWLHGALGVNALVPDDLSDLAGGATFNDAQVEVTRRGVSRRRR